MLSRPFATRSLILLLISGLLISCSSDSDKALSDNLNCADEASGIVNGYTAQKMDSFSSSTVLLLTENRKKEISVCTGTLIDDQIVLTAAHCAAPKMYVTFVRNASCLSKMENVPARKVTRSIVRQDKLPEDLNLASNDLMLLRFEGSVPSGFYPRALPQRSFELNGTETLLMAGYGRTTESTEDSGILRFTQTPATNLLSNFYLPRSKKFISLNKTLILDQRRTGVCLGDSGGPLYAKTQVGLTLIGITSVGVDTTTEKGDKVCQGVALFTDVRAHLDWIHEATAALRRGAF